MYSREDAVINRPDSICHSTPSCTDGSLLFFRSRQISRDRMAGARSRQERASLVLVRHATAGHGALGEAGGREQGGVVRGRLPRVLHFSPRATVAEGPQKEGSRDAHLRPRLPPPCLSRGGEGRAGRPSMETTGRGQLLQPLQRMERF